MSKKDVFIRGIDEEIYLEFKSKSVRIKKTLGETFNEAMELWLKKQGNAGN